MQRYKYYTISEANELRKEDDDDSAIIFNDLIQSNDSNDVKKALELLNSDFEKGDSQAIYLMSTYYKYGLHDYIEDHKLGKKLLWKAARGLDGKAIFEIGIEKDGNTKRKQEQAIPYFITAAIIGEIRATYCLADCLEKGHGISKSKFLSEVLLKYIEMRHIVYGSTLPPIEYDSSDPRYKHFSESEVLFLKRNYINFRNKFNEIWDILSEDTDGKNNIAIGKIEKELANNNQSVNYFIGLFYKLGINGYNKDKKQAMAYFKIAAEHLVEQALYELAIYKDSDNFDKKARALPYFIVSGVMTNLEAINVVANCFDRGVGVKKNKIFSRILFKFIEKIKIKYFGF